MAGLISVDLYQLVGKTEGTIGTDSVPTATDNDCMIYGASMAIETEIDERTATPASGDHARATVTAGSQMAKIKFGSFVKANVSLGVAPSIAKYLKACGMIEVDYKSAITAVVAAGQAVVTVGGTVGNKFSVGQTVTLIEGVKSEQCVILSKTATELTMTANITTVGGFTAAGFVWSGKGYRAASSADESGVSFYGMEKERGTTTTRVRKAKGCMGNAIVKADATGKAIAIDFDFTGAYGSESAGTAFARSWLTSEIKTNFCNAPVNIGGTLSGSVVTGGVSAKCQSFELDTASKIAGVATSAGNGYDFFAVIGRAPTLKMSVLKSATFAGDDKIGDAFANTITSVIIQGKGYTIHCPNAQVLNPTDSAKEGIGGWDLSYNLTGGDDALTITTNYYFEIVFGAKV
jgi:hypothetical protein